MVANLAENPLLDMTTAVGDLGETQQTPAAALDDSALIGFKRVLNARRAVREYDRRPLPEAVMRECLRDATLAPSSSNLQTYQLFWVRAPALKKQIAQACLGQPAALTASDLVVVVARADLWEVHRDHLIDIMTNDGANPLPEPVDDYYNRIVPLLRRTDRLGLRNLMRRWAFWQRGRREPTIRTPINRADHRVYGQVQAALAAQTLMLSLAAHGFDSCPIGGMDKRRIHQLLSLPRQADICMLVSAGHGRPEGLYGDRVRLRAEEIIQEV